MSMPHEVARCRCPQCRCSFRVLADEIGMHACPRCGYDPYATDEDEDEWDDCPDDSDVPDPDYGEGWAGAEHECACSGPDDSCPACSAIEPRRGR